MRRQRRTCPTTAKLQFSSEAAARDALDRWASLPHPKLGGVPQRVYRCPWCRKWHMTSQPDKAAEATQGKGSTHEH